MNTYQCVMCNMYSVHCIVAEYIKLECILIDSRKQDSPEWNQHCSLIFYGMPASVVYVYFHYLNTLLIDVLNCEKFRLHTHAHTKLEHVIKLIGHFTFHSLPTNVSKFCNIVRMRYSSWVLLVLLLLLLLFIGNERRWLEFGCLCSRLSVYAKFHTRITFIRLVCVIYILRMRSEKKCAQNSRKKE